MILLRRSVWLIASTAIVLAGVAIMVWLLQSKPLPEAHRVDAHVPTVAVQTVVPRTIVTPVVGYGTVRPKNQVQIVPQVSGEVVFSHADLATGKVIAKGALLFELDPSVYQARVQQAQAEVRSLEAALALRDQEMANLDVRIILAEKMLEIDERNYLGSKGLLEQESIGTRQGLDATHQKLLQRQDVMAQLTNRRATAPHLKRETQAKLDAANAKLLQVQYDLRHTKIFCPFTARVDSVKARQSQMVTAHLSIATLTDIETLEIPISVNPRDLRWLDPQVQPQALVRNSSKQGPDVVVTWSAAGQEVTWRGRVARFERMDEATRTARMIVEVSGSELAAGRSGQWRDTGQTISIGMHCRSELPGKPLIEAVLIPRQTVHDDRWVYVFEPATDGADSRLGRLARRDVSMLRMIGEEVLVDYRGHDNPHRNRLKTGDQLVVSRLADSVTGMRVSLRSTIDRAPIDWNEPSSIESSEFAALGEGGARLVMSESTERLAARE